MYGFCLIHANFFSPFHLSSFFSSSLPLIEACSTLTFFPPKCYCLQVTYDLFAHWRETEKFAFTHHKWVVWYTPSGLTRSAKLATVWFAVASPEAFLVVSFVQVSCPRKARNGQRTSYFWGEFFQKCGWTENFRKILENKWEETKVRNNNFVY